MTAIDRDIETLKAAIDVIDRHADSIADHYSACSVEDQRDRIGEALFVLLIEKERQARRIAELEDQLRRRIEQARKSSP